MTVHVNTVTVAISGTASASFGLANAGQIGINAPVLTSCQAFLLGSPDNTDANFARVAALDGSGDFTWSVGVGSSALRAEVLEGFAFAKVELSIAQAAARNFIVTTKL